MKTSVFFMFFVILIGVTFVSCQKEEMVSVVNIEAIRAQLAELPVLTKEEVHAKMSGQNLKSADMENEPVLVQIFPLESWTFEISEYSAVKYFIYYEINKHGFRKTMLTLSQIYEIVDGAIDFSRGYELKIQPGCPFNKDFYLNDRSHIDKITVFFHFIDSFNEDKQFAYYLERGYLGEVKLPPIAGGNWQLSVIYDDGDMSQTFMSNFIDWNSNGCINLKFKIKTSSNIYLQVHREYLENATVIHVAGEDENGDWNYFLLPINHQGLTELSLFALPFHIKYIYICGEDGCRYYEYGQEIGTVVDLSTGKIYYRLF